MKMKRLGMVFAWFIIGLWCVLIAVWTFYNYAYQEKPTQVKSIEFLNPDTARESLVRIENAAGTTWYGTGFFVTPDKIATNIHVIAQPGPIVVNTIHKEKDVIWTGNENGDMSGKHKNKETNWVVEGVSAFDIKNDLAILKVNGKGTPFILGNSKRIKKNEPVTIIGFPFKKFRVKKGKVYSVRKSDKWLRSDMVIGGGSSGSPVLNEKGQVIGVHSYIQLDCSYSLASPSNVLKILLKRSDKTEHIDEWHKRDEIRSYAHYINGQNSYNEKDFYKSIKELDIAIQLDPASLYAYIKRGQTKSRLAAADEKMGNSEIARILYVAAIKDYTEAIKYNPKNAAAYSGRANAKFELGDHKESLEDYNRAIEINSRHEVFYHIQGINKIEQGDAEFKQCNFEIAQHLYEDAIDYYGFAIKRSPKAAFLYIKRANAESKLGNTKADQGNTVDAKQHYEQAIEDCIHAIKLKPQSASAYNARALANYFFGKFEAEQQNLTEAKVLLQAAIEDWSLGIALQTEDTFKETELANAYKNQGNTKIQLGKIATKRKEGGNAIALYADAIDDYTQAIQLNPKDTHAYSKRGWGYYLIGKYQAQNGNIEESLEQYEFAIFDCEKSSQLDPNNAYAFYNRGVTKAAMSDTEDAINDFNRAIQINPRYAQAYYERGIVRETLGQKEKAKADFDKANEFDPNIGN